MNVTLVDYGIGNILSVRRALEHLGADVVSPEKPSDILRADRVVVPGVGAFRRCMEALDSRGFKEPLLEFASSGRPFLGICVGMQMLLTKSEEFGVHSGLGLIPGRVRRMEVADQRIPFVGWKPVAGEGVDGTYYFVHSYAAVPDRPEHVLASYELGGSTIVAAVGCDNIVGVQFHPEKSAESGLRFLGQFLER